MVPDCPEVGQFKPARLAKVQTFTVRRDFPLGVGAGLAVVIDRKNNLVFLAQMDPIVKRHHP